MDFPMDDIDFPMDGSVTQSGYMLTNEAREEIVTEFVHDLVNQILGDKAIADLTARQLVELASLGSLSLLAASSTRIPDRMSGAAQSSHLACCSAGSVRLPALKRNAKN
jgi:hypothetical protein